MKPVVVYTTSMCWYCNQAKALLQRKGIPFQEIDVSRDAELREEVMRRTGRRTVPQIFVGERAIGGFDDLSALERSGELDGLLAE
jgi:glutaredoxin 3